MIFKSLEEKCNYYRSLTDYRVMPNGYIMVMIDGKNFSSLIKNKFEKPFDDWFIDTMNETAIYLCKKIQNVIAAYSQSDEISLIIEDNSETSVPFGGRLCKLLSIIPSTATSFFTKKIINKFIYNCDSKEEISALLDNMADYMFDCKVWSVPNQNDAFAWFLYRQIDCLRNSKQQFCQTYLSHKQLLNLHTDDQVVLCKEKTGNDWNAISDDKKYGRIFVKRYVTLTNDKGEEYRRGRWMKYSVCLTNVESKNSLINEIFNKKKYD